MKAVFARGAGGVDVLELRDVPPPEPAPGEVLVRVFAAGINRADILQRRGLYPAPSGAPEILGLEFAGEVAKSGGAVSDFAPGDGVFGLVQGGGYAEFLAVDARLVAPIPDHLSFDAAAAVPEAFITANENLCVLGGISRGERALIYAGASGVGSAAIQLARAVGARVIATAGTREKCAKCLDLGAERAVDRHREEIATAVLDWSDGRGVDVLLDLVGAAAFETSLRSIGAGGRWLVVGLVGGARVSLDLGEILRRRLRLFGNVIRTRSLRDRIAMVDRFRRDVLPLLTDRSVRPVIDRVYPLEDVRAAHSRMEENLNAGKIILRL